MEGAHFAGGPWFTVVELDEERGPEEGWQLLDTLWISDGRHSGPARIELRLTLEETIE